MRQNFRTKDAALDHLSTIEQIGLVGRGDWFVVDHGPCVHPRYSVSRFPQVGDAVSKAFNGDSYPCGKITRISDGHRTIWTDSGMVFTRRKDGADNLDNSNAWYPKGGRTFYMIDGHHNERNPSF